MGFDASFLDDRLGVAFTYYHTLTQDGILLRPVAPSYGFATSQYVNAGEILNQGIEALVNAQGHAASGLRLGHELLARYERRGGEEAGGDRYHHRHGQHPIQDRVQPERVVPRARRERELRRGHGQVTDILCDDGQGGTTPCYNASGQIAAPRVYLGRTTPSVEGSVGTTFVLFQRLRLNALADFKSGFKRFDNNLRARCQIFRLCLENMNPEEYDPARLAQIRSNGTLVDFVINDAKFIKLREISLSYAFPDSYAQRFGARSASVDVAARNLHTWTPYTGLDPENQFLSGSPNFLEQDNLPQLMQFVTTFHVIF